MASRVRVGTQTAQHVGLMCAEASDGFSEFTREDLEQSITTLFARQVARHADRVAVKTRDHAITYRQLDQTANRIARAIAAQTSSIDGERSVALLFGRTIGAVAATLGVLEAGCCYVPLDPSHPPDRLTEILADSKATVLVTDDKHLPLAKPFADRSTVISIDALDHTTTATGPTETNSAETLAAIFYTSGTTGKPKGVMQDHRSILHRVMIDTNTYRIRPDDRLSLLSPPTYSVSLRNLFGALLNGATVCPFDIEAEGLGQQAKWVAEERLTIYSAIPTVFRHFASALTGNEHFNDLRLIDIGGEGALKTDVELYRRYFPVTCMLANTLGCNEAGVYRRYLIDKQTVIDGSAVPVGYAVPDKDVVLLADGKEVGINQLGQIAIRTRYLPRGYWGMPALTDAAFVADPRGGDHRLYLTGDMGEMQADGRLIYKGRRDTRVKIRGQFVDLAELELRLQEHIDVDEVVVKAFERSGHRTQLVAFVVPSKDATVTVSELRRFLARTLPAFMTPSKYVFLTALPRSTNGKIDRQALTLPDEARRRMRDIDRADGPAYVAPAETVEHQLVEIWEELLRVHPISVRDNFFDLGGDSLLALQMMEEVELRCGETVPASALMTSATLAELAQTLVAQRIHRTDSLIARVQSGEPSNPFFFLHGDFHGGGFYCLNLARALGPEQRVYAVTPFGLNGGPVPPTIEAMAASYIEMIQAVEPEGPYLLGGLCHAGLIAFEMARQLEAKGHTVSLVAMIGPPAWNPPHWRWLKDAVAAVVRVAGGDADRATDVFLALRNRRMRVRQFCQYVRTWVEESASVPMRCRIEALNRLAKRLVSGAVVSEKPWAEPTFGTPPTSDEVLELYRRAVASYVRRPYRGRLALYWPEKVQVNTLGGSPLTWSDASDPALGWRHIAAQVDVQPLPGDYTTSITTHVQTLADRIKTSIVEPYSMQRADTVRRVRRVAASWFSNRWLTSRVR